MSYQNKHKNLTCSGHSRSVYVFSDEQLTVGLFVSNQNSLSTLSVNFSIFWYIFTLTHTIAFVFIIASHLSMEFMGLLNL